MYSLCKQIHPPTSIEYAISCFFFNYSQKSLVTAGKNVIRVFNLIPDVEVPCKENYTDKKPPKMKLECVCSFHLFGNVCSLQAISLAGSKRDALLLSFKEAKMCVVEYDPDSHDLKTLSLHYFEEDEMKGGWTNHYEQPVVRVDTEGRCAAMLVYGRKLVILPFREESKNEDPDMVLLDTNTTVSATKAPVMASYTISLRDIDEKLENVIDMQFLYGYYEPTLLILYEPIKTFPGRIAVRMDTCCMVAVSLNIQQKVHPAIWSVPGLPFDCLQAIPVKKPLGGTLIFGVNSLIYLNQSIPPFGVTLNSLSKTCTNFQLKEQENLNITLEAAQATFFTSDKLVVSLKTGELYVLSLIADSMRSVRGFHFEKAAASVLTTCVCLLEDKYLFLGSRLGNSLLLRYAEKEGGEAPVITLDDAPREIPTKKKRQDDLGDWMASNVAEIRDLDELEVYGNQETTSSVHIASYYFEVCDSFLNVGPIGCVAMGEPAFLSEEYAGNTDPDIELVTTSGHGKNGAICVLQRSIRPQVITTFELAGCMDTWTVVGPQFGGNPRDEDQTHAFLILSQAEATMVLQTGQEINEVDNSGFNTQVPTVFAGNMGSNKYIVQVTSKGVRLLRGLDQLQQIPIDVGSPIIHASLADPYLALLTADGQLLTVTLRETRGVGKLSMTKPNISGNPKITKICSYRDISGLFTLTTEEALASTAFKTDGRMKIEADDEDELLYGTAGVEVKFQLPQPSATAEQPNRTGSASWKKYIKEVKPNYWLFVVRENGTLDIFSLPDCKESYQIRRLGSGQRVLYDDLETPLPTNQDHLMDPEIHEIGVFALGHLGRKPLLLIRTAEELFIYQAFKFAFGPNLKLRFKRINQTLLVKDRKSRFQVKIENEMDSSRANRLRYFSNIANYNGIFVCGSNPHWLFLTARGELRAHPMPIDGRVNSFAAFHNVNCPQGFLYFNSKSELRICILPTHLSYDNPWPVRKVPLRCTPHQVTYHLESKTFCVATSSYFTSNEYYKFNGEDKEHAVEERDARFPLPLQQKFNLFLFSPVSWEVIPNTTQDLEEWEHVTCLKTVQLSYEGTTSGLRGYIAVGTNYNYSEDITSKGRVLIYDVIEVVPEPGMPLTKNRFKPIYSKEQKGPITALCHVSGFLVTAMGQKIYIWQLKNEDLVGIAFIDTQIYIHQMISVKNLIVVADVFKSISLLRFQEEYRTLSLVSRDYKPCEVYSVELLIDNNQIGFLVADAEMNVSVYMYKPGERESLGGQKLIRKADFNTGQHIISCFRIKCKLGHQVLDYDLPPGADKRHITAYATLDGALGFFLPLPEKTYRRLQMMQNILVHHIPHIAGLNPKDFRMYKSSRRLLGNPSRCIVDGDLVWMFMSLTSMEKHDVAKKIGSRVSDILEDIADIERLTAHF